jgi:hypothetical protein
MEFRRSTLRIIAASCSIFVGASLPATVLAITPDDPGPGDVVFSVNSGQNVKSISPYIYGMNFFAGSSLTNPVTLDRLGGNRWTGYNWETNYSNAGHDWYFQSDTYLGSGPPGEAIRPSLEDAAANGRALVVTVPIAGYVAADAAGPVQLADVAPSSRWREVVPNKSTVYPGSPLSLSPNETDGYVFTDEMVNWVEQTKESGQTVFYDLDNEPGLWGEPLPSDWQPGVPTSVPPSDEGRTHGELHPYAPTFAELRDKTIANAGAIKDVNPDAMVFGGVGYGWEDFRTLQGAPDQVTSPSHPGGDENGELQYYEWLLKEVATAESAQGRTLMDVLDLHWYPEAQGGGVRITENNNTSAVVAARVQAPRSLWDSTYTETSWITEWSTYGPIKLLPRVQRDIDDFKPDTKIAITEYNYGGTNHISGAIAQADALGIFGEEGVFAATFWSLYGDSQSQFTSAAFNMYLDYDGAGGTFGDVSVDAATDDIAASAIYASVDSEDPNRMVLVAINRTGTAQDAAIALTHDRIFDHAEIYRIVSGDSTPDRLTDVELSQINAMHYTMPAWSVTTLVLIADGLPGDYNRDGTVDAADYTVWRDSLGQTGDLAADGNEDNSVDDDDYLLWRENFGRTEPGSGAGTSLTNVPEPATIVLIGWVGVVLWLRRPRAGRPV